MNMGPQMDDFCSIGTKTCIFLSQLSNKQFPGLKDRLIYTPLISVFADIEKRAFIVCS